MAGKTKRNGRAHIRRYPRRRTSRFPTRELSKMYTYAQNFEDVMLNRLFHEQATGFYVDVGAWDPNVHSVTKHFYNGGCLRMSGGKD
ncbi:MAG: hypothetical protein H0X67_07895 [Acidobacteria bacterium]|nr:hypothetical protein [Acidobacteriota bacterium]